MRTSFLAFVALANATSLLKGGPDQGPTIGLLHAKLECSGVNFDQLDGNGTAYQQGDDCVADHNIVQDCDCSDPENYSFADFGRFLIRLFEIDSYSLSHKYLCSIILSEQKP